MQKVQIQKILPNNICQMSATECCLWYQLAKDWAVTAASDFFLYINLLDAELQYTQNSYYTQRELSDALF